MSLLCSLSWSCSGAAEEAGWAIFCFLCAASTISFSGAMSSSLAGCWGFFARIFFRKSPTLQANTSSWSPCGFKCLLKTPKSIRLNALTVNVVPRACSRKPRETLVGGFNPSEKYESVGMVLPNIWENKIHVPNHQSEHVFANCNLGSLKIARLYHFVDFRHWRSIVCWV